MEGRRYKRDFPYSPLAVWKALGGHGLEALIVPLVGHQRSVEGQGVVLDHTPKECSRKISVYINSCRELKKYC